MRHLGWEFLKGRDGLLKRYCKNKKKKQPKTLIFFFDSTQHGYLFLALGISFIGPFAQVKQARVLKA